MANVAVRSATKQSPRDFLMEFSPDELRVTADHTGAHPFRVIFLIVAGTTLFMLLTYVIRGDYRHLEYPFEIGGGILALAVPVQLLARDRNLRCTRDQLTIIEVRRGRTLKTRSWPRSEVGPIRYGVAQQGGKGPAGWGLLFTAGG